MVGKYFKIKEEMICLNKKWWKAALIRAAKTICQTAAAMVPTSVIITEIDWKAVLGTALLAGVASILTSLAGIPEVENEEVAEEVEDGENEL